MDLREQESARGGEGVLILTARCPQGNALQLFPRIGRICFRGTCSQREVPITDQIDVLKTLSTTYY